MNWYCIKEKTAWNISSFVWHRNNNRSGFETTWVWETVQTFHCSFNSFNSFNSWEVFQFQFQFWVPCVHGLNCHCPVKVSHLACLSLAGVAEVEMAFSDEAFSAHVLFERVGIGSSPRMRPRPHWSVKSREATQTFNLTPSLRHWRRVCVCACVREFGMGLTRLFKIYPSSQSAIYQCVYIYIHR